MANINEVSELLSEYLKTKGDLKADYTISESEQHEITMKDGELTLFRTLFDNNLELKVIRNNKKGTKSINKLTKEVVEAAVDEALTAAETGEEDECFDIAPGLTPEKFSIGALEPDIEKLMERTIELSEYIAREHKLIKVMELCVKYVKEKSLFVNTNGTKDETKAGYYYLMIEYAGNDGNASTGVGGSTVIFDKLDKPFITLGSLEKELTDTENSFNPINIKDKFDGDVIFTPLCTYQLLWHVMVNTVSDYSIMTKVSKWLDSIGKEVASPLLTIRVNPWDERVVKHEVHTADGFRSENYDMIENGVLRNFATSLYVANKCGVKRAPNSSANIIVEAGETSYEDMVKGIKKGLIVGGISCGMPGANGEISGVAKNAFYVENGKIKGAVIETMISGNLFDMLKNIKAISKEQVCDGDAVTPNILVGGVNISGN